MDFSVLRHGSYAICNDFGIIRHDSDLSARNDVAFRHASGVSRIDFNIIAPTNQCIFPGLNTRVSVFAQYIKVSSLNFFC